MDLQCEFIFPFDRSEANSNNTAKELTVGDVFYAACTTPEKIEAKKFDIFLPEKVNKYSLKLLGTENQDNKWVFKMTSYVVGKHDFPKLELFVDGKAQEDAAKLNLGSLQLQVKSVLNPQEKTEPFGPIGGITIPIPLLYWLILVFLLISVLTSISTYLFFKWRRKKMLDRLEEFEINTSPLQQFYGTYRKIQRENVFLYRKDEKVEFDHSRISELLSEIEKSLKLYLLRKFKTPALEKSWKMTLKDLNKYHPEFMTYQSLELKEIISEIEKARKAEAHKIQIKDLHQVFEKIRLFIEYSESLSDAILKQDKAQLKKLKSLKI